MPNLRDNLRRWRETAEIDWFSQFIKAWIPFNAWMTDTFGDLSDRDLLDMVKAGNNVVFNRVVPMLSLSLRQAPDGQRRWQDESPEAAEFRLEVAELHRLLQGCVVTSRRGRISFETVDVGANGHKDEQRTKWKRKFRVRRDHPNKDEIALEISATKSYTAYYLCMLGYDRRALEDNPSFQSLKVEQRTTLLSMFDAIAPRRVMSVLAAHSATRTLVYGGTAFIPDSEKVFSALVDVIYSLRNALFHGSITPNETHNKIYEPAYRIAMKFVQCTI